MSTTGNIIIRTLIEEPSIDIILIFEENGLENNP